MVDADEKPLYEGPAHRWEVPVAGRRTSFLLFAVVAWAVAVELILVAGELFVHGLVLPQTARGLAVTGILFLLLGNSKTIALALGAGSSQALGGALDILLARLWLVHFWFNPFGVFSLGLFLMFAPRAQPPFYYIAYGVLLWQTTTGLLSRQALPLRGREARAGRAARAAHHQPAVYVLLITLAAAGFVNSLFT
jgi:hypothetical protein